MDLVFKNVKKSYGSIVAIRDIDFSIKSGEFVFLVGPSGAGKSTILKLILNQIKPTSGEIHIGDHLLNKADKNTVDHIRRQIGVIYQDYLLINDKTIEENIALALDINRFPANKVADKIEQVISEVNLSSRRHLFPSQLSGGELQRASLARALAIEPKIILADEPTGNLDLENTWNLIKLIKKINEEKHTTIIMTTHNQDIVQSLDKRVLNILAGEVVSDSSASNKISSENDTT